MAEQPHLITDPEVWQKRKCTKCEEWKYATGYGGETRPWNFHQCPDCANERITKAHRKKHGYTARVKQPHHFDTADIHPAYRKMRRRIALEKPEKSALLKRFEPYWRRLRKKFRFRKIDWLLLYYAQQGVCAICQSVELNAGKGTCVDHDHDTGQVRGLLCDNCNTRMAAVDQSSWLERAVAYKLTYS